MSVIITKHKLLTTRQIYIKLLQVKTLLGTVKKINNGFCIYMYLRHSKEERNASQVTIALRHMTLYSRFVFQTG